MLLGGVLSLHAIVFTVCGGPTFQSPGEISTSAGGKSTVLRVHLSLTSKLDEIWEMLRALSGFAVSWG